MEATTDELAEVCRWTQATLAARQDGHTAQLPFSFMYGGQPSATLLQTWMVEASERELDDQVTEQALTYTDPNSGLQIRCVSTLYRDFPAVEWVIYLKNAGDSDTPIIEGLQPLDTTIECRQGRCAVHYANGSLCSLDDFAPLSRTLNPRAELHLQPGGGRSSSEVLPFFNVETAGEGVVLAVGWTGEWRATFARDENDWLRVRAGMAHTHFRLHPGEEVRSPRILVLFWQGERMRGHNLLRRFVLAHHRPTVDGQPLVVPTCAGNWGGTPAAIHLDNVHQIVTHELPVETYWIDAEWFGDLPWWQHCGDWEPRADLYPQGLQPIGDALHAGGRKFLLWFEPERVCRDTAWYREHEDWLLKLKPGDECLSWPHFVDQADPAWSLAESRRNQIAEGDALLDLGNPEARAFLTDAISEKIGQFGIDCYRHDANIAPLEFWRNADDEDRQGITEMQWVAGLYAFWDELLRRHPGLMIDNCASGGRRIDLETISRSTPLWRTDHPQDPIGKQCHTYGLLFWVPLNATGALNLVTDDDYTLRSTMSSGLVFKFETSGDVAQREPLPATFPFAVARARLDQVLAIREYFCGDYYPLTEYSQPQDAWMAYQLDRPERGDGLVVVLKRPQSAYVSAVFPLRALDRTTHYHLTNLDTGAEWTMPGSELIDQGLDICLTSRPDSALIAYQRG